ncbi:fatty acid desaturase [Croceibacterium ferulae]|uniref:fatty acid desaturase n=1 Tax=Croceibacterium ferulae TaxID=1854641 RepID=UPI0013903BAB|nr:fatty acid desaturase [Croceibacterium ferulae]
MSAFDETRVVSNDPPKAELSLFKEGAEILKGLLSRSKSAAWKSHYSRFKNDPYYMLRYYAINLALLTIGIVLLDFFTGSLTAMNHRMLWLVGLVLFVLPNYSLIFLSGIYYFVLYLTTGGVVLTFSNVALIPAGVLTGTISAAIMHNAAHDNFQSALLNRILGEVCGLFQLSGYVGWTVSHHIHHAAPDNPQKDAHAPGDMRFGEYVNAMGMLMKRSMTETYFKAFGYGRHIKVTWASISATLPLVRYARVLFTLALVGPTGFVFFYVPFKIANTMIYGDFNYRTHRPNGRGGYEVLNLNHNIWFKLLNAISIGSYYHKNHHRCPKAFNPRHVIDDGRPFVTYHR